MYQIKIHRLVEKEDFKRISVFDQKKILSTIYKKLTIDPVGYGKPLLRELKKYYRIRVGDYRVIYSIDGVRVLVYVIKIGLRKDFLVYLETAKRLKLMER